MHLLKYNNNNNNNNNNKAEEAIVLLFQDIDYGDSNGVEAQLIAELETTTLNINEAIITRSDRIRRASGRFRNS
jgi:hypothetical protein